jgi:hypothetical protein
LIVPEFITRNQNPKDMYWKTWLVEYCPKDWTIEDKLYFIQLDCPEVTMEEVVLAIAEHSK